MERAPIFWSSFHVSRPSILRLSWIRSANPARRVAFSPRLPSRGSYRRIPRLSKGGYQGCFRTLHWVTLTFRGYSFWEWWEPERKLDVFASESAQSSHRLCCMFAHKANFTFSENTGLYVKDRNPPKTTTTTDDCRLSFDLLKDIYDTLPSHLYIRRRGTWVLRP